MKFQISSMRHRFDSARDAIDAVSSFEESTVHSFSYRIHVQNGAGWVVEVSSESDAHGASCLGNLRPVEAGK